MYDEMGNKPQGASVRECKPDYEAMAAKEQNEINVFFRFKDSLLDFINCIGRHSIRREPGTLPELLGKVELDLIEKKETLARLLKQIEKG